MPEVKIYTTATCVYCRAEKQFFDQHNIKYQEIKADEDPDLAQELFKLSGQFAVPFTLIRGEDGKEHRILGFDQPKLAAALELT